MSFYEKVLVVIIGIILGHNVMEKIFVENELPG